MIKFEKVSKYQDIDFDMPTRKTKNSAGYDMVVAEDIIIPSYQKLYKNLELHNNYSIMQDGITLKNLATITKESKAKPTLVPTGVKCYLEEGYYLELSVRSSSPLKYWLILANGVGIIDADYADNPDNEGHIYFQLINLSPFDIQLKKGDIIGQGIIKKYEITDNDNATGDRTGGFGSTTDSGQAKGAEDALRKMSQRLKETVTSAEQFIDSINQLNQVGNVYPITSEEINVAMNNTSSNFLTENIIKQLSNNLNEFEEKGVNYL